MSIRYIVVGLGNIGTRRRQVLGSHYVGGVDPLNREADWLAIDDVPPESYDAAVLSVPNQVKIDLLSRLLAMGKDVLVEKPLMFPDCDTAAAARDLAHQTGTVWYTSYPHRFEPLIVRLKGLLEEGIIGPVYNARLVYGNGTVKNCIGTWRESGYGVLEDLGCHLIDLTEYLFNYTSCDYRAWEASCMESQVLDHCVYATADRKVVLECATTMWKNEFGIDIYGQLGSLHMQGLRKWGPTELIIRKRVFPSGVPVESREICDGVDESWHADVEEFEKRVASKVTSFESDLAISMSLHKLAHDVEHLR
jgi:scyllo-inositol 2-dehydrogenase (NADP+)